MPKALICALVAIALTFAAACGNGNGAGRDTPTPAAVCLGEGFRESGEIASFTGPAGPARMIVDLRWARHEGCERFVIELAREDGSAAESVGDARARFIRELGILRIDLPPAVDSTRETEQDFGGPLAAAAYVIRRADRGLTVDLHLASAAIARVTRLSGPARLVVDLQPGGPALTSRPLRQELTVVLTPTGPEASYPLEIVGYARNFEANVIARIRQGGVVRVTEFTTATDWTEAWGMYTIRIVAGPTGDVELFVGGDSPRDGTEQGVRRPIRMR